MSKTADEQAGQPGIARKVAFLSRADAYPDRAGEVRRIETHMSWVFLVDDLAYKLKKPVRFPYLDFSTVEARRQDCEAELRLNRRLAPGVYLGTVALTREAGGELALGGQGPAVDWLVRMRRLPETGMLDHLVRTRGVPLDRLRQLVALLAGFYRDAPAADWAPGIYTRRVRADVEEDGAELMRPRYGLPAARIGAVVEAELDFLAAAAERFERRVYEGRVVDGHGDLRPEHVCLDPGPVVIDCLEFNRDFRLLDAADELAFLALECERLGDANLGARILEFYTAESGDEPDAALVSFYKCRRACLRAKIAIWHLRDADLSDPQKWTSRALSYLTLAERHAAALR